MSRQLRLSIMLLAATLLPLSLSAANLADEVAPNNAAPESTLAPASTAPANEMTSQVPVISGGIGDDMDNLRSVQNQYNLKLMFTEGNGVYLANVPVSIKDKHGNVVVNTVAEGPILLAKLPAGSYTVTASQEGQTKEAKISVGGKGLKNFQFRFPTIDPTED